jgi:hypothetical protein
MDAHAISAMAQVELTNLNILTLNFTSNCTAVGELFGTQGPQDYDTPGIAKPQSLYFALPDDFRQNQTGPELLDYSDHYLYAPGGSFTKEKGTQLVEDTRQACWKDICDTAYRNRDGNPDIGRDLRSS